MPKYFRKSTENNITQRDYAVLCVRFACETFGCPVFGRLDDNTLEFPTESDVNDSRKKLLRDTGYVEVSI
jgi:hypothetical protein